MVLYEERGIPGQQGQEDARDFTGLQLLLGDIHDGSAGFNSSPAAALGPLPVIGPMMDPLSESGSAFDSMGGLFVNFIVATADAYWARARGNAGLRKAEPSSGGELAHGRVH